ncbi:hypothetical protein JMJ35_010037 [Cladonia borealis]|uniref:Uncharacterized protein n=1 Tax=Cladonia borealis TaxID=184061 RepID=A0AA39QTA7_9LECA|nr:hypothetical protein JMJ35_010037 [Cladonia borealis]
MPTFRAIGQIGLGGFLYVTAQKLINKLSQYGESAIPLPERPARYKPAVLSTLSAYSSSETMLPIPNLPQNTTATMTMSSHSLTASPSTSPLWTMILSLWSPVQVTANFLTEHCGELVTDLTVQLLFYITMAYLGHHIDQALTRLLGHPRSTTADEYTGREAPITPFTRITKATIQELHELADKIQHRINNLEATIDEHEEAAHDRDTEAKRISQLEVQCNVWKARLAYSEATVAEEMDKAKAIAMSNAEKATMRKVDLAKANAAGEINELNKLLAAKDTSLVKFADLKKDLAEEQKKEKDLVIAITQSAKEIAGLKEALAKKEETEKDLVATNNQSAKEIARLEEALAKKKEVEEPASSFNPAAKEFTPSRGASSVSTHTSTPLTSRPATPFSPSPSNFPPTPYQRNTPPAASFPPPPSQFTTTSYQHTSLPGATFTPSASPYPTTPSPLAPVQKQELTGEAKRNLEALNEKLAEQNRKMMIGLPAKDEETKLLSAEELDRRMANIGTRGRPSQQFPPAAPAFTPRSTQPFSISPVPSPTISAPELGRRPTAPDMTGQSPTSSAPELGQHLRVPDMTGTPPTSSAPELGSYPGTADMTGQQPSNLPRPIPTGPKASFPPPQHHIHHGVKPGAPGTQELKWPAPPASKVPPGTPTGPKAMRLPKPKTDAESCFVQPRPRPKNNRGNVQGSGRGGGSGTRSGPPLPAHLQPIADKKKEEERSGGGKE